MIDELILEITKLKWVIIVDVLFILVLSGLFWFLSRNFAFNKRSLKVFSSLYKLEKKRVICVGLIIGRLLFVITSAIFCDDINIGYLLILLVFTILIFVLNRDMKMFISSLINYSIIFLLIFIESALFNYYQTIEKFWLVAFMAIMIGVFVVGDGILTSINSYLQIAKGNENG